MTTEDKFWLVSTAENTWHRVNINNAILDEFLDFMPEPKAKELIAKIAKGEIPNVIINY